MTEDLHPNAYFSKKITEFQGKYNELKSTVNSLSLLRIFVFIIFLVSLVVFANLRNGLLVFLTIFFFPFVFGLIVKQFNRKNEDLIYHGHLITLCQNELDRLSLNLKHIYNGIEFSDRKHAYSSDLDLFGKHSLFQLLNRTVTSSGKNLLVNWMLYPADRTEIKERQHAIVELKEDSDWRIKFLASGSAANDEHNNAENLTTWIQDTTSGRLPAWWKLAGFLMPAAIIAVLLGIIYLDWSIYLLAPPLIINSILLKKLQPNVATVNTQTSGNVKTLKSFEKLVSSILLKKFHADRLKELAMPFNNTSLDSIKSLRKLLDFFDGRGNMFYAIFNLIFLIDYHLLSALYRWKSSNREDLSHWFENIGQLEALSSLAGHAFIHPGHTFPTINENYQWSARGIAHPLISINERVANDFEMDGSGTVIVITGSNMSGKSTFLRTVAVNTVLGLMGSVVCAEKMSVPRVQVFTGMRTEDDLSSHISSFYAELKRIRKLLTLIDASEIPVFYFLDEILKGTNTEDRHRGSIGLLNQLSETNAMGFVSTHDLELGRTFANSSKIRNFSFNSSIEGDEINFDYQISKGICHSFNASKLMQNMGIRITE